MSWTKLFLKRLHDVALVLLYGKNTYPRPGNMVLLKSSKPNSTHQTLESLFIFFEQMPKGKILGRHQ